MMYEMKGIRYAEELLKFLLATAMAWLGCIALVSCDQGDTGADNTEAHITLTLCLKGTDTDNNTRIGQSGGKQIASRSEDDETDEPGTEMENSIDLSRFHVVFYQANQQMAGILQNMVLVHLGGNIYRLTGSLPVSNKVLVGNHFEGKMVVYANFDMSSDDLQKDYNDTDIAQKSFGYEANPKYLPMWVYYSQAPFSVIPPNAVPYRVRIQYRAHPPIPANPEVLQMILSHPENRSSLPPPVKVPVRLPGYFPPYKSGQDLLPKDMLPWHLNMLHRTFLCFR